MGLPAPATQLKAATSASCRSGEGVPTINNTVSALRFSIERAVFTTALHRLMTSGSDRAFDHWRHAYQIDGAEDLQLHHFYRAMAWLGEELGEEQQDNATPVPRCTKDLIEEQLFAHRRDLFTDLSLVFLDTTSLSFTGEGGETLGRRGKSKDHRPDLMQMLLAVVMDGDGRPVEPIQSIMERGLVDRAQAEDLA